MNKRVQKKNRTVAVDLSGNKIKKQTLITKASYNPGQKQAAPPRARLSMLEEQLNFAPGTLVKTARRAIVYKSNPNNWMMPSNMGNVEPGAIVLVVKNEYASHGSAHYEIDGRSGVALEKLYTLVMYESELYCVEAAPGFLVSL